MDIDNQTLIIIGAALVIAVVAIGGWLAYLKQRSNRLRARYGPEYQRAVEQHGSAAKAESDLLARQKRVERFHIVPLTPPEAARFADLWRQLQLKFVDNPKGAVAEADALVRDLMGKRGYPMADFERSAADLSVDHPQVVSNYRAAHAIAERDARGESDTEALRRAVVHYRALFTELLEVNEPAPAARPEKVR